MEDTVLKVENLSKRYRLGVLGQASLKEDVGRWLARMRGKEDPTQKVDLSHNGLATASDSPFVWALQDVNFEVKRGEVLGVIGKNGAGKSTLLKVLSKVTAPTTGQVKVKGRVASLLEVGTGFHPELTGRENIFLNGAILGMTKAEIRSKLDEIIDFSGVARYVDTPVKRYSSGMYVRLAFAVAAHLEPEILIVDEVLAVGDAEFQSKAIGKMQDVAQGEGRTVLFVSHNMNSIATLTHKALVMNKGSVGFLGETSQAITYYIHNKIDMGNMYEAELGSARAKITQVHVKTSLPDNVHDMGKELIVQFRIETREALKSPAISFQIMNTFDAPIAHIWLFSTHTPFLKEKGTCVLTCRIPKLHLYLGEYSLKVYLGEYSGKLPVETLEGICPFKVQVFELSREHAWQANTCTYLEDFEWDIDN